MRFEGNALNSLIDGLQSGLIGVGTVATLESLTLTGEAALALSGDATVWRNEQMALIGAYYTGAGISVDATEGAVVFADTCDWDQYIAINLPIPHDWKLGSSVYAHLRWEYAGAAVPNLGFLYRWQVNGGVKTSAWSTLVPTQRHTYSSGTLNQMAVGTVTPPVGYGFSDILQLKIVRDTPGDFFAFTDPLTGNVSVLAAGIIYEVDCIGAQSAYSKVATAAGSGQLYGLMGLTKP